MYERTNLATLSETMRSRHVHARGAASFRGKKDDSSLQTNGSRMTVERRLYSVQRISVRSGLTTLIGYPETKCGLEI